MTKVLVLYYSAYGRAETVANAFAEDARYKLDELAPVGKIEDLANFDAVIVGTGTRFGPTAS